jgi:hypothetical protein
VPAGNGGADRTIPACTGMIAGGREIPKNLAIAYHNRGSAYLGKRDNDRAIQDYGQAIRPIPPMRRRSTAGRLPTRTRASSTGRSRISKT